MTDTAIFARPDTGTRPATPNLDRAFDPRTTMVFVGLLCAGMLFVASRLYADMTESGARTTTVLPYLLLLVALVIALGFEFVNRFHDTENAVATVIYPAGHGGAPKWKVIILVSYQAALQGIITGVMRAISRMSRETAPSCSRRSTINFGART